ncbi:ABC transporter ATP-binding protein/permease [Thermosynechococcus sp. PP42]|uniref:ABC transporter ATP-binding protein/permease n=1 Tax=Thermosynechococcus sp. PP42 TaxID=3074083 RepID=UPI00285AA91F|nr:ABC transporter ATP-binding protein/permease [Thermosynechococcus sp. PP42]MDR5638581.1 ABC transporter ATP-binding protein/permease [Thermosynechococcus sp. PP42]
MSQPTHRFNLRVWGQFLRIAQPYFFPRDRWGSSVIFILLLFLVIALMFGVLFGLTAAITFGLNALAPELMGQIAGGLMEMIQSLWAQPLSRSILLGTVIVPLGVFALLRQPLLPRWQAWALLGLLLMLSLSVSGLNVIISFVGRFFQTALAEKNAETYWRFLLVYAGVFVVGTPIVVIYRYVREYLGLRWRDWLTRHFLDRYFQNRAYYTIENQGEIDNPDQRITEDIRSFTQTSLQFLLIILGEIIDLIAFSGILWSISQTLTLTLVGYAIVGTIVTVLIGQRLIWLNFNQLRREADFRYGLVHVRDNAESIAFYRGEGQESVQVRQRFLEVLRNFNLLIGWQRNLDFFTTAYNYFVIIVPAAVVAPRYFAGEIDFGAISQASFAFSQVLGALSIIVNQFTNLTGFIAGIERLAEFDEVLTTPPVPPQSQIELVEKSYIALEHVAVDTPNLARRLVEDVTFALEAGDSVVIMGPSGVGKSSLLRAIAGLWQSGSGRIIRPPVDEVLFLPQRPYMVLGTLRTQLLYPSGDRQTPDDVLLHALNEVNLAHLPDRVGGLDVELAWDDVLSLGEQQRLAIARLLLNHRPYAILDEATSALDLANEKRVYEHIQRTTRNYISVGHRESLMQYHKYVLELKGDREWKFYALS